MFYIDGVTKKKAKGTRKKRKGSADVISSDSSDFVQKKRKRKKPSVVEVDDDLDVAATNSNVVRKSLRPRKGKTKMNL